MLDQDFDYRYIANTDVEDYSEISGSKVVVMYGHDEYWTREARENIDRFVDNGGCVLVLSGNTMYRRIVYDDPAAPTTMHNQIPNWRDVDTYQTMESLGENWYWGGYQRDTVQGGWRIVDDTAPYLQETGLVIGDVIQHLSSFGEVDGIPISGFDDNTGVPLIDEEYLSGFYDYKLIAFDKAMPSGAKDLGNTAWIEYQRTADSGRMIVVGSPGWTDYGMRGDSGELAERITVNMIDYLLTSVVRTYAAISTRIVGWTRKTWICCPPRFARTSMRTASI